VRAARAGGWALVAHARTRPPAWVAGASALAVILVVVGAAFVVVVPAVPAAAHTAVPGVRNLVDRLSPATDGVTVTVRSSVADELVVTNTGSDAVQVLSPSGEPFLRISRSGTDANTNSVFWYASESLAVNPITSVPGVDPGRGPRWLRVSDGRSWSWFDPRLRPDQPADVIPPSAESASGPVRLASWVVPLVIGGRPALLSGHREYRRVEGAYEQQLDSSPSPLAGLRLAVVGGSTVPAVYLDNRSDTPVTVLGRGGEPLLRLGPAGTQANTASPSWVLTGAARDEAPTGLVAVGQAPRWEMVSKDHQFSWLDDRGRAPGLDPPKGSGGVGPVVAVRRWRLTLEQSSHRSDVTASVMWQPLAAGPAARSPSSSGIGRLLLVIAGGGAAGGLVAGTGLALRRRRHRRAPVPARS